MRFHTYSKFSPELHQVAKREGYREEGGRAQAQQGEGQGDAPPVRPQKGPQPPKGRQAGDGGGVADGTWHTPLWFVAQHFGPSERSPAETILAGRRQAAIRET